MNVLSVAVANMSSGDVGRKIVPYGLWFLIDEETFAFSCGVKYLGLQVLN